MLLIEICKEKTKRGELVEHSQNLNLDFVSFFQKATGYHPFPYQVALALDGERFPEVVKIPTGAGKTAGIVLAWLWRRCFAPEEVRANTPRRLVYCLPMRVLVEQTYENVIKWLDRLGVLAGEAVWRNGDDKERLVGYSPTSEKEGLLSDWSKDHHSKMTPVAVYMLMGGEVDEGWDLMPEQESIIIGTQDMLLSRALHRGYAMSRFRWPVHFALLNNDCLWIMDEVQLMGVGLQTSAQLDAFRRSLGTFGPHQTVWMSATCEPQWLDTIDRRGAKVNILKLEGRDLEEGLLRKRMRAPKKLIKGDVSLKKSDARALSEYIDHLGELVLEYHKKASSSRDSPLTLVMLNTVERAQQLYLALREKIPRREDLEEARANLKEKIASLELRSASDKKTKRLIDKHKAKLAEVEKRLVESHPELYLIHSRFRPPERQRLTKVLNETSEDFRSNPDGRIIISTQVIEAGIDISGSTLITELAPWSSLVQRFGRLNRYGEHESSLAVWVDIPTEGRDAEELALPYSQEDLMYAREQLGRLSRASPEELEKVELPSQVDARHIIRRKDIMELFDTTPDLMGDYIDVSRFVRDTRDNDVQVFWREWEGDTPPEELSRPTREELCPVLVNSFKEFCRSRNDSDGVWVWDYLDGRWVRPDINRILPGQIFLVHSNLGGYDPELGWCLQCKDPVTPVNTHISSKCNDAVPADNASTGSKWQTIAEHSQLTKTDMERIIEALSLPQVEGYRDILLSAALYHDIGKAHTVFQSAITKLAMDERERKKLQQSLWAKSGVQGRIRYSRKHFRHEMASALLLIQNPQLIDGASEDERDLVIYLVAAHHGKVRLSIRSLPDETVPWEAEPRYSPETRYARGIWDGDTIPEVDLGNGQTIPPTRLDLSPMEIGGGFSWLEKMLSLLDREDLGPFRLGYLEALVRIADWRASQM